MTMTAALADTLAMVAETGSIASDPWWIIGSAAVVLHGGEVRDVKDVDLMMSARDADAFLMRVDATRSKADASDRFKSRVFATWSDPPIPVEVFGGFSLAVDGLWREVSLITREAVRVGGGEVFVPSADELVHLLESFGRSKDLKRARLLRRSRL